MPPQLPDPHNLARFVQAQDPVIATVQAELEAGQKRTHWMWFIFPQLHSLGTSPMALRYAITGPPEAQAYLDHQTLGPRLRTCTDLVLATQNRPIRTILGTPDDQKFQSCMTLFTLIAPAEPRFQTALQQFYANTPDPQTIRLFSRPSLQ